MNKYEMYKKFKQDLKNEVIQRSEYGSIVELVLFRLYLLGVEGN